MTKKNKELKIINAIPANLIIDQWPDSLRVLLYNLIVNSIQNTIKGFITIDYNQTNNGYSITVSDTGVGMSSALVNYLLIGNKEEEIHLMPKNRKGNGVGFQIIRNLIQLMRAKIDIESAENRGTKVTIFFTNSLSYMFCIHSGPAIFPLALHNSQRSSLFCITFLLPQLSQ